MLGGVDARVALQLLGGVRQLAEGCESSCSLSVEERGFVESDVKGNFFCLREIMALTFFLILKKLLGWKE